MLLAAAQGLFLAIFIFQKYRRILANKILAALIFLYSLVLLNLFFSEIGYYHHYPLIMTIPIGFPFMIGPLHYLYASYLLRQQTVIQKWNFLHLIPFLLCLVYFFPGLFWSKQELITLLDNSEYPSIFRIYNWILIVQAMIYIILTLKLIQKYSRYFKDTFSSIEKVKLSWLINITLFVGFGIFVFIIENMLLVVGINLSHFFNLSSTLVALYVYGFGYLGLIKSEMFINPDATRSIQDLPLTSYTLQSEQETEKSDMSKYSRSGLTDKKAQEYINDLFALMDDIKPYQNSNLSLHQLAEMLSISAHNLSEVINVHLKQNFFELINHYRVEQVKRDLKDPQKQNLTLLSIAHDAGFNSKSSFNVIFKRITGQTPSEYRQSIK